MEQLDRAVTLAINGVHCPFSDSFWIFMSSSRAWIPLYLLIAALMIWRLGWKKGLVAILCAVLSLVACDQLCNLVKNSVCRLRPCFDQNMIDSGLYVLSPSGSHHRYGFFSAHAANTFGLATVTSIFLRDELRKRLSLQWKRLTCAYVTFIYAWASLVALSRVFLSRHFAGDILAGALAGALVGLMLAYAALWIYERYVFRTNYKVN